VITISIRMAFLTSIDHKVLEEWKIFQIVPVSLFSIFPAKLMKFNFKLVEIIQYNTSYLVMHF